jgi:hypothetical protein
LAAIYTLVLSQLYLLYGKEQELYAQHFSSKDGPIKLECLSLASLPNLALYGSSRVEAVNHPFVKAADDYLQSLGAVDAALIFEGQTQLDQVTCNINVLQS